MALIGAELLEAVDAFRQLPRAEIVRRCGYVSSVDHGSERLNYTAFFEALLEAKGFHLGQARAGAESKSGKRISRAGRTLPYHTKVQFNGNLMVGKAYLDLLDAKPGDHFAIRLGRDSIRLVPLDEAQDPSLNGSA